jgi:hypothetical protein
MQGEEAAQKLTVRTERGLQLRPDSEDADGDEWPWAFGSSGPYMYSRARAGRDGERAQFFSLFVVRHRLLGRIYHVFMVSCCKGRVRGKNPERKTNTYRV